MARKQQEAIGHLFHTAHSAGINLKQCEFDPFDIEYFTDDELKLTPVALVHTGRITIPSVGDISWGSYVEGSSQDQIQRDNYEGIRRKCNVGILVARRQFKLLELPSPFAEYDTNRLHATEFAVPAVYDPTVRCAA